MMAEANPLSEFQELFGDSVDFDELMAGREQLTGPQVKILFKHDLQKHLDVTRRILPLFDTYPLYVQAALADAVYRGDLGTETAKLIRLGKWNEAAVEYLDRKDYKNRVALNVRGIGPRMERNRDAMLRFAAELTNKQPIR
jgi:hypothetical protein